MQSGQLQILWVHISIQRRRLHLDMANRDSCCSVWFGRNDAYIYGRYLIICYWVRVKYSFLNVLSRVLYFARVVYLMTYGYQNAITHFSTHSLASETLQE